MIRYIYIVWNFFWRVVLIVSLTAAVIIAGGYGILQTDIAKNQLAPLLQDPLSDLSEYQVSISEVNGRLPQKIILRDVRVDHPVKDDHLHIEELRLAIDLWEIFFGTLRITNLELENPVGSINYAASTHVLQKDTVTDNEFYDGEKETSGIIKSIEFLAPNVRVSGGYLVFENTETINESLPDKIILDDINAQLFLEYNPRQTFVDIFFLDARLPGLKANKLELSGQLFNEEDYYELNGIRLRTENSYLHLLAEAAGLELQNNTIKQAFSDAYYNIRVDTAVVASRELGDFYTELSDFDEMLNMHVWVEGDRNRLIVREYQMEIAQNYLTLSGYINNILDPERAEYSGAMRNAQFAPDLIELLNIKLPDNISFNDFDKIKFSGNLKGTINEVDAEIDVKLPEGVVQADAKFHINNDQGYSLQFYGNNINLAAFPSLNVPSTDLNFSGKISGNGFNPYHTSNYSEVTFTDSRIADEDFEFLSLYGIYRNRFFEPNLEYRNKDEVLSAESSIQMGRDYINVWMDGTAENINLSKIKPVIDLPHTNLNLDFMFDIQIAGNLDESYGWISADVRESLVDSVSVREHQFYGDLDPPTEEMRSFRFTSSFLDIIADGNIKPLELFAMRDVWMAYINNRIKEEFLFETLDETITAKTTNGNQVSFDIFAELKDLELLKHYFPRIPIDNSVADLRFSLLANDEMLEIDGTLTDRYFSINGLDASDVALQLYTSFQRNSKIREYSVIDLDVRISELRHNNVSANNTVVDIAMRDGRALMKMNIEQLQENLIFEASMDAEIHETGNNFVLEHFKAGSPEYLWTNVSLASVRYSEPNRFQISNFIFENNEQFIQLDGVMSPYHEDLLYYDIQRVDLSQISDFYAGRIPFSGMMDGNFMTQSLTREPVFEGDLLVDGFSMDNRIVGDIRLRSSYNPDVRQFETSISVITDEDKYADLLSAQNAVGQQIYLDGVLESQATARENDRHFHFDVNVARADLWFLPILMPDIFLRTEGIATGAGVVTGTFDRVDFAGEVLTKEAAMWPVFFNTRYDVSGPIKISRSEGVIIQNLQLWDGNGGRGVLNGFVDFNEFQTERFLDVSLEMNNLKFLDNRYDPDIPFYGTVYGTGTANISGSNLAPFVRTVTPIVTSSRSSLSIPLLPETYIEEQGRFIHFVEDFSEIHNIDQVRQGEVAFSGVNQTFTELFRLDLQFIAEQNSNVRLIFDPVTDEIMNARGSGRMRIMLEDEEYSMFGRFDVTEGDYMFVGGDIFTRRFLLNDGGSIIWDGDPENARLNVVASYRSRPNINSLLGIDQTDLPPQRIPVDLMLLITGTIENVENDFYFEFPNSVDATQNATILAILNSEEQKFLQATSLLLTGGFIPTGMEGQSDQLIATTQSRAGQVGVSQLLSAQINSIINANLANLDIDLNMTGFDQADLGVALRLFDDRLVLRRDGQVAGEQTDIGDLGAKYRINNALSVEVFHRKDPSLTAIIGAQGSQVESVNGIGLEAQMQFNTWGELRRRVWGGIKGLFVRREDGDSSSDPVAVSP